MLVVWGSEEDGGNGGKERKLPDLESREGSPMGGETPPLLSPHKGLKPLGEGKEGGGVGGSR